MLKRNFLLLFFLTCFCSLYAVGDGIGGRVPDNYYLNSELFVAIRENSIEDVQSLLSKGADVNAEAFEIMGRTHPLHVATARGYYDIVELLASQDGCDINKQDSYGSTPLHLAVKNEHHDIIRFLVDRRAKKDIQNYECEDPPFWIASRPGFDRSNLISGRDTLLHMAIKKGDVISVFWVYDDSVLYIPNVHGKTPCDLAQEKETTVEEMYERGRQAIIRNEFNIPANMSIQRWLMNREYGL